MSQSFFVDFNPILWDYEIIMANTDLTFITNEKGKNLKDRFSKLVKDTRFFDVLVGYFYTSGFYAIYPQLEKICHRRQKNKLQKMF